MIVVAIIIGLAIILDQVTKNLIVSKVELFEKIAIINDFFYITHTENKGAAWGILQNQRALLLIVTGIALVFFIVMLVKNNNKYSQIALSLIIGGAIGNFIDRIFKGKVVDFLDFYFGSYHYPTFNLADICVVIGAIMFSVYVVIIMPREEALNEKKERLDRG